MKSSVYRNAAVLACSLGLLGLLVGCFEMNVSLDAENPVGSDPQLPENPSSNVSHETLTSAQVSIPSNIPDDSTNESASKSTLLVTSSQTQAQNAKAQGTLRMMNQTTQPVRLALLSRKSLVKSASKVKTSNEIPAHWDFAPQEGSEKGLRLALPNGDLKLEKGDILVAFAQDGSRRYWGPYVVGETSLPTWNAQTQEWQLVLSQ
jgi:hypothetical protein